MTSKHTLTTPTYFQGEVMAPNPCDLRPYLRCILLYIGLPSSFFYIARQHAMHAERDIVLANPSVRPSIRHILVLYLNVCIS